MFRKLLAVAVACSLTAAGFFAGMSHRDRLPFKAMYTVIAPYATADDENAACRAMLKIDWRQLHSDEQGKALFENKDAFRQAGFLKTLISIIHSAPKPEALNAIAMLRNVSINTNQGDRAIWCSLGETSIELQLALMARALRDEESYSAVAAVVCSKYFEWKHRLDELEALGAKCVTEDGKWALRFVKIANGKGRQLPR